MRQWRFGLLGRTSGLIALLAVGCAMAQADEPEVVTLPPRPRCVDGEPKYFEESCAYLDRRNAIAADDAQAPQDALYGLYEFHTGTNGAELALDRDGWAGYHESSDGGVPISGVVGRYQERDGVLVVELERIASNPHAPTRLEYHVVRWGRHVFLFPAERLPQVVATLDRDGLEQASFDLQYDMQRFRNRKDPLCGSPRLPAEWLRNLHPRPLHVSLAGAQPDPQPQFGVMQAREYLIEIAAGRAQGLFPRMYLQGESSDSEHWNINATIERVEEHRAWGKLVVFRISTTDSPDAFRVGKGTHLVSGKGWKPDACVPMR
jgi:hypothetical protein